MGSKTPKKIEDDEIPKSSKKDKKEKKRKNSTKDDSEKSEKQRKKSIDETAEKDEENQKVKVEAEITNDDHATKKKDKKEKKRKKSKDEKERKKSIDESEDGGKRKKIKSETGSDEDQATPKSKNEPQTSDTSIKKEDDNTTEDSNGNKHKKVKGNPEGITRLFLGNLPFKVDEEMVHKFLPGCTHIKWITDKTTGKFYGSAFVEMTDSVAAAAAVARSGEQIMKRPIKVNFAPAKEGEIWPPKEKVISGGQKPDKEKASIVTGIAGMKSEKPEGCVKLFLGNLSYDIDDDKIKEFFATVEAEVKAVRWIYHKESGDFKGVGYVEFWKPEVCERAATLNGKVLLGRPIRIDWTN